MRTRRRSHPALVAGLVGAGVLTLAAAVLHTLLPSFPFLPLTIAQVLVRAPSGSFDAFFIERLGHWAKRLAVAGTCLSFVSAGATCGLLLRPLGRRLPRPRGLAAACSFAPLWLTSVVLYPADPLSLSRWQFALVSLPLCAFAGIVAGRTYRRLAEGTAAGRAKVARPTTGVGDPTRRSFIGGLGIAGLGVALGLADLGRFIHPRPDPGRLLLADPNVARATTPATAAGDRAFRGIPGLSSEITPLGDFYVVNEELIAPDIDPATWRLAVGGVVGRPYRLAYDALKRLPAVERYQTLQCVSNLVGGEYISTTRWIGVPLPTILRQAGVRPGAVEVVFRATSGYSDSLPIQQAMDPSTLIAIGMDGHVLPRAHGFPARLLSTGTYGMKNPKWLTSIEVVDRPYTGFWEARGWSKPALVKASSRIDTPRNAASVSGRTTIAGIASSGDRGISRVEVSTDGGRTWREAQLSTALSPLTWRLWRYDWTPPEPGSYRLSVRAVDGWGSLQTEAAREPFPSGSSGYHTIGVSVA